MEKLKYVSAEYQERLDRLAETLCTPERFRPLGQLALFELPLPDNVIELFPGPEAA